MLLTGGRVALDAIESTYCDLAVRRGRVFRSHFSRHTGPVIDLTGMLVLPGLINAHDHLELNLFPRLGNGNYRNAKEWATDIYRPDESPIREHVAVPKLVRLLWGGIKNLLSGVTCVAHHNPYCAQIFENNFPIRVLKRFGWAHSLPFTADWRERKQRTPRGWPFIIHAGEGTDEQSRQEIYALENASALTASTVLVHAVAAGARELPLLQRRTVSVVWCPTSNYFTLGRTLSPDVLSSGIPIALGTDSALTGAGDLTDEIDTARRLVPPVQLYKMVTTQAAQILRLGSGAGCIRDGAAADLIAVVDRGSTPAESLVGLRPELVVVGGRIKLISPGLAARLPSDNLQAFRSFSLAGLGRWLLPLDIPALIHQTRRVLGREFRVGGRAVSA